MSLFLFFLCLVILGWSPKIFDIINELIIANENQRNPAIVILTSRDRSEIQYMIKDKINNSKNTRIICRNGDPMSVCKKYKKLFFFDKCSSFCLSLLLIVNYDNEKMMISRLRRALPFSYLIRSSTYRTRIGKDHSQSVLLG